jgi:hypothetical protein
MPKTKSLDDFPDLILDHTLSFIGWPEAVGMQCCLFEDNHGINSQIIIPSRQPSCPHAIGFIRPWPPTIFIECTSGNSASQSSSPSRLHSCAHGPTYLRRQNQPSRLPSLLTVSRPGLRCSFKGPLDSSPQPSSQVAH